ncbi:MAG: ABC transporter permease [Lachnospiraceae bacterium]|nr:ABC transporter permease [Lachnospiraceae bacterium]
MGTVLKNEFQKLLRYKGIYIALIIGTLIVLGDIYYYYSEIYVRFWEYYNMGYEKNIGMLQPPVLMESWIGHNLSSVYSEMFYVLLPFIAVLPFGVTYYEEIKSGYMKNVVIRVSRRKYVLAKYIVTFVSGGFVCMFPTLLSAWIASLYLPNIPLNPTAMVSNVSNMSFLSEIFYSKPLLYILIYSFIAFLFGGIFATMSIGISHLCDNRFFVYFFPFLLSICTEYIFNSTSLMQYTPNIVVDPNQRVFIEDKHIFTTLLVMFAISVLSCIPQGHKKNLV